MQLNTETFEKILDALLSPDNNERQNAENAYNQIKTQQPDTLVQYLFGLGFDLNKPGQIRGQCFIYLRRAVSSAKFWPTVSEPTKQALKNGLLTALENENNNKCRANISDTISELGGELLQSNQWPELLPFMFKLTKSPIAQLRESSLNMFCDLVGGITDLMKPYLAVMKDIFSEGLSDPDIKVKLAALQATGRLIGSLQKPNERNLFQDLTQKMLDALASALNANKEDEANSALQVFVELAETGPSFFRPFSLQVVNAMLMIAGTKELDESIRHLGIEVLITLVENRSALVKKVPDFMQRFLTILLHMMVELEDNPKWNQGEEADLEDDNCSFGEQTLDRLALVLGGEQIISPLFAIITQLLNSQVWQHRHAAMMSISIVGEGCVDYLKPHLKSVLEMVLPRFNDAHERVRWAACNTAGQMSTDFGPEFQTLAHSAVIPAYIRLMDDYQNPRVQSHAASAIVNFCEKCEPPSILDPYLSELLGKIVELLTKGQRIVHEQAVTAVAAIAECIKSAFIPFYGTFLPYLKQVLEQAHGKEFRMLRGKAMECLSLIGTAVGKEVFINDARQLMPLLSVHGQLDPDDPQTQFILQAWTRIAKCLGEDFVPYLPQVMPYLIETASIKPEVKVASEDEQEEGWDYINIDGKFIGIRTSTLDDKSTACSMLSVFIDELKDGFFPYAFQVAQILLPSVKFHYHEGVRSAAISSLAPLLTCVSSYFEKTNTPKQQLYELGTAVIKSLLEQLPEENEWEINIEIVEELQECFTILGENWMNAQQLEHIYNTINEQFKFHLETRGTVDEKRADLELEPDEELEDDGEKELEMLSMLGDLNGVLARTHHAAILPHFGNHLLPLMYQLMQSREARERQIAICVFDDIAEHTREAAIPLYDQFLPILINFLGDPSPQVKQAAVYGIGVCAAVSKEKFAPIANDVMTKLNTLITLFDSKSKDNVYATENAISAFGKIMYHLDFNVKDLFHVWLSYLPTTEDDVEAIVINDYLCKFFEHPTYSSFVLGDNYNNLPKLLSIFGQVVDTNLVDEAVTKRIQAILKQMQTAIPPQAFVTLAGALPDDQKAKLQTLLSS